MSNGNTLTTEASVGRIFEVTSGGEIVWEYIIPFWNAENSNATYRAYKVPLDWAAARIVTDLVVAGNGSHDPVDAGQALGYTIDVTNTGSDPAVTVELAGSTPVGTTFQSISAPTSWSCTTPAVGATGSIACSTSSLNPGSVAAFTTVVVVDLGGIGGTTITNTVAASSLGVDATPGDNSITIETTAVSNTTLIQDLVPELPVGSTGLRLGWGDWAPGCGYRVLRSMTPNGGFGDLSGVMFESVYVDAGAIASPGSYCYLIQID